MKVFSLNIEIQTIWYSLSVKMNTKIHNNTFAEKFQQKDWKPFGNLWCYSILQ